MIKRVLMFSVICSVLLFSCDARLKVAFLTEHLPDGMEARAYYGKLEAIGGSGIYTYKCTSGDLSAIGLAINTYTGLIAGTPPIGSAGTHDFTFEIADDNLELSVKFLTIRIIGLLEITTTSLPNVVETHPYNTLLEAAGGIAPYIWSCVNGDLNTIGLQLNTITGEISGSPPPNSSGIYDFTFEVTDCYSVQQTVQKVLTITVVNPVTISTTALTGGIETQQYNFQLIAANGIPAYTWDCILGDLTTIGLALDPVTGEISGVPSIGSVGTHNFTIEVTDSSGDKDSKVFSISIIAGPIKVDFIADVMFGTAPLTVQFSEMVTSTFAVTGWSWDFDNNGSPDSALRNAQHIYTSAGKYSVKLTATISGCGISCTKTDYIVVVVADTVTWTGTTSTDWAVASNWNPNGVPDKDKDVVIPNVANSPVLLANAECRNIEIQASASLTAGSYELDVYGNWENIGTFTAGTGTVIFSGNGTIITSSNFNNIRVKGHYAARCNFDTDGNLTIDANASFEGRHYVLVLKGDFTNNGSFTHQAPGLPNAGAEEEGGWWFRNYKTGMCPDGNISYNEKDPGAHTGNSCVYYRGDGRYFWGTFWVGRVVSIPSSATSATLSLWARGWIETWGNGNIYIFDGDLGSGSPNPQKITNWVYRHSSGWTQYNGTGAGVDLTPWIGKTIWIGHYGSMHSIGYYHYHSGISDHGRWVRMDDWEITIDGVKNGGGLISQGVMHFDGLKAQQITGTPQYEQLGIMWVGGKEISASTGTASFSRTELTVAAGREIQSAYVEVFGKLILSDDATLKIGGEAYGGIMCLADMPSILSTNSLAGSKPTISAVNTFKDEHRLTFIIALSSQMDVNGLNISGFDPNGMHFSSTTTTNRGIRTLKKDKVDYTGAISGGVFIRYRGREILTFDGCSFDDSFNFGNGGHNVWTYGSSTYTCGALTFTNHSGVGSGAAYEFEDVGGGAINW